MVTFEIQEESKIKNIRILKKWLKTNKKIDLKKFDCFSGNKKINKIPEN